MHNEIRLSVELNQYYTECYNAVRNSPRAREYFGSRLSKATLVRESLRVLAEEFAPHEFREIERRYGHLASQRLNLRHLLTNSKPRAQHIMGLN